ALRAQLIDERGGRDDFALDRPLRLFGDALVHEVDRDADARHGQQRAGDEDAAPQRGQNRHRTVKSSSARPPSGTSVGLAWVAVPSFHAMTEEPPGGTLSIR